MSARGDRGGGGRRGRGDGGGRGRGRGGGGGGRGRGYSGGYDQPSPPLQHGREQQQPQQQSQPQQRPQMPPPPQQSRPQQQPAQQQYLPSAVTETSASTMSREVENLAIRDASGKKPMEAGSSSGAAPSPTPPASTAPPAASSAPVAAPKTTAIIVPGVAANPPPLSSKALRPPPRPGFGTAGTKCVVKANHFLVKLQKMDLDLHHYDVAITPEVISKGLHRAIINQLVDLYRESHLGTLNPAYDGKKNLYTAGPLPFNSKEFVINLSDKDDSGAVKRAREFKVVIKFAAKLDLYQLHQFLQRKLLDAPQETIQLLDVVLRERPSNTHVTVGRSFFSADFGAPQTIGNGVECWRGYYQSLRPTQMGMSLNIDLSATSFFEPLMVSDFIQQYLYLRDFKRPLTETDCIRVKKALRGVKVETTHRKDKRQQYRITGISKVSASQLMFTGSDNVQKSVAQYFNNHYGYTLKLPNWPCLQCGSNSKPSFLPMEVCFIVPGQRYTNKLSEKQVTEMLNVTCQRPHLRENGIAGTVKQNNYSRDKLVSEFGIDVMDKLTTVAARVLPTPQLKYHETGREKLVCPTVGAWNMINKKMVNGGTVSFWACVNFSRSDERAVRVFCGDLVGKCCDMGMIFSPAPVVHISAHPNTIEKTLVNVRDQFVQKVGKESGVRLQLLIVVLPDLSGSYGKIKKICETDLDIVSQCCQPRNVLKCGKQYLENVALKINVKVGGRNTVLNDHVTRIVPYVTDKPTIIFGADVTHPQPGEDSSPSIAAVVASMDWPAITKYKCLVSAQKHREEIITDLYTSQVDPQKGVVHGGLIRDLLRSYYRAVGQKPHRIIFYRDGVSEGQFNSVLLYEMDAIRKACVSLEENYLPPVTFVVVQKRHHTRLFPADYRDKRSMDRSGNILAGTIVDTTICHPTEFDFYLCSHAGIQGTSRPTHYHVLYDENRFTADALQTLTNNLCYTYARCTRSVSIVPPAYYAHLAAFRARYYMEDDIGSSSGVSGNAPKEIRALPTVKDNVKEVMFFC